MAKTLYCWRCKTELPMLEEHEWKELSPLLTDAIRQIKSYREEHGASIAEAHAKDFGQSALAKYFELTGFRETNPNALWHHRASLLGAPCTTCGKPLRTSRARFCAECGARRSNSAPHPEPLKQRSLSQPSSRRPGGRER